MKLKAKISRKFLWSSLVSSLLVVGSERSAQPIPSHRAASDQDPAERSALPLLEETALALEDDASANKGTEADTEADRRLRELFVKEQFGEAARLAQEQLKDPALSEHYKSWLKRQMTQIKLGWAWSFVRQKNCQDALPLFEEALHKGPQALALKGLGYCYLERRDWWTASTYLDSYIEQKGSDPEGYLLLAEAKESIGSYDEALSLTRKAQDLGNLSQEEGNALRERAHTLVARADEGLSQTVVQAGNFMLRYQPAEHHELVEGTIELLQTTELNLTQQLGLNSLEHPVELIFHKVESFDQAAHGPAWASAIYDGRIRIPVASGQILDEPFARVLRHELTHALLSEQVARRPLPTWLQEGLAQVAECPRLCWNYTFAATQQPFLDIESFGASFLKLSNSEAQVAYKQSLYLVQVLYRINGLAGIRQIVENMPRLENLSADSLLGQNSLSFAQLHQKAKDYWMRQTSF